MIGGQRGELADVIARTLDVSVSSLRPLSGGSVAKVFRVDLANGTRLVAKQDPHGRGQLALEGRMLRYLASESRLPVPEVLHDDSELLLIEYATGRSHFSGDSQRHAAELLADLHGISHSEFGFAYDTLIGGLHQPNPWSKSWLDFFREHRLLYMGRNALDAGRLPDRVYERLERFASNLEEWLTEPEQPSLIHGDAWSGNILAVEGRISAFLDPAIYFADAEIELAFTTLFGTFDHRFFDRYREIRPIRPGFMDERRVIYNLYPLLVHVRLFGGGYVESVSHSLAQFGY